MRTGFFLLVLLIGGLSSFCAAYSDGDGSSGNPYQISDVNDLLQLAADTDNYNKYFILTADLDMGGVTVSPIGNSVIPFNGNVNGQNHVIRNITLNFPNEDYVGLFGYVGVGGVIVDLNVEDVNVFGKRYIGGLAGYNSKGTISNCHSTGLAAGGSSCFVGGLIGFNIGGTVSNCSSGVHLTGTGATLGGFAGCNFTGSTISNCWATGLITDNDFNQFGSCVGGLVGDNYHAVITDSYAAGNISATLSSSSSSIHIGGLVGESRFGTISGCYATGVVYAVAAFASEITCGGGLIGFNSSDNVNNCYATGPVTFDCSSESAYYFGGLIGLNFEGTINRSYSNGMIGSGGSVQDDRCTGGLTGLNMAGYFYGCFWDISSSGKTISGGGRGLVTEQMKSMQIYQHAGWAGNGWIIDDGQDYPHLVWEATDGTAIPVSSTVELAGSGTAGVPYEIWTVDDFMIWGQYASVLDKHTRLMADLDLNGVSLNPVGEYGLFTGTFDGNGHVIGNVTIAQPTNNNIGFFGHVGAGGVITGLGIENVIIVGGDYVGGLIGKHEGATVSNCHVTGTVDGLSYLGGLIGSIKSGTLNNSYSNVVVTAWGSDNSSYLGGLIGYNNSASVNYCYAMGEVNGNGSYPTYIGGLAGYNSSGTITSSYATCSVNGFYYIGGLVGDNRGPANSCYATGSITGNSSVGGLMGVNSSTLTDCYATGSVSATGSSIGGLAGVNVQGRVIRCYSTGRPTGSSFVGGLCGRAITGGLYQDAGNFWDTVSSLKTISAMGSGRATAQMKMLSTFASTGWNFTGIWAICEGTNYPRLRWQIPAVDFDCPDGVGLEDLDYFVGRWLMEDCASGNNYCGGADVDNSGGVDLKDFSVFTQHWLEGI